MAGSEEWEDGTGSRVILLLVPEDTGSRATLLFFSTEDVDLGIPFVCLELFTGGAGGSGSNYGSRSIPISCEHLGQVVSDPSHSSSASNFALQKGHRKWNDIFLFSCDSLFRHEKRHIPKECPSLRLPQRLKVHTIRMCQIY